MAERRWVGGWCWGLAKSFVVEGSDENGEDHGHSRQQWFSSVELLFACPSDVVNVHCRQHEGQYDDVMRLESTKLESYQRHIHCDEQVQDRR